MINVQELISTLKSQHNTLRSDMDAAYSEPEVQNIILKLEKFKVDLINHIKLENTEFYPDYMNKKTLKGESLDLVKDLIEQMGEIAKEVMSFLDKYNSINSVNKDIMDFRNELLRITDVLKIRLETEEEGIYEIYLLM